MTTTPADPGANVGIQGLIIEFDGDDMGEVSEFGLSPEIDKYKINSVREGFQVVIASVVRSKALTVTFASASIFDDAVEDKWAGSTDGKITFNPVVGPLKIIRKSVGKPTKTYNFPSASLSGVNTSGDPSQTESKYLFSAEILADAAGVLGTIVTTAVTP